MKLHLLVMLFVFAGLPVMASASEMWEELFSENLDDAEDGDVDARYEVGVMYLKGQGVQSDRAKAVMWLRRAADDGHEGAARKLQRMEEQQAKFEKLRGKAESGNVKAQYEVAMMYLKGRGVDQDGKWAQIWLGKAAKQGDVKSIARLGILKYKGEGGKKDYAEALSLFRQVSDESALAQYYLGEMYADGAGVKADRKTAIDWYRQAADNGFDHALGKIINLEEELKMTERRKRNVAGIEPAAVKQSEKPAKTQKKAAKPVKKVTAASKPAKKKVVKKKAPPSALDKLAQQQWSRGKRPVDYLPSRVTQCERENQNLVCLSEVLERTSGTQLVKYRVKSVVTAQKSNYVISYRNLVLGVTETREPDDQPIGYDDGDEVEQGYNIRTGWTQEHTVNCSRGSAKKLQCIKDKTHKISLAAGG